MKKKSRQDERVVTLRRKIQSDAFGIVYFVLLISTIVQEFFLKAPFEQYAVEMVCFLGMSVYLLIRNIVVGNNIFGDEKRAKTAPLLNSLVCGITATVIFGILNYSSYSENYENNIGFFIAALAVFFISITVLSFAMVSFFVYMNKKRQAKIQKQLDEEE